MITPKFSCSQTEQSIVISVYCPSVRASDVEINVDDTLFTLHINPYYLRLNFPRSLEEDDESSARYDASSGYLTVTLTKAVPGQVFEDLDLLAKLLAPRPSKAPPEGPLIEVLDSQENQGSEEDDLATLTAGLSLEREEILEAAENDWQLKQELPVDTPDFKTSTTQRYGFLDMYSGYFQHVTHTENEINELGADVETLGRIERRKRRIAHEDEKWDEEYYMADYAEDDYIQELLHWTQPHAQGSPDFEYTDAEKLVMLRLPRKEYLASSVQTKGLYLTLLSLLFSYSYDARTTQHDPTPESGWTVSTLTPAFSALDPPPYSPDVSSEPPSEFGSSQLASTFIASYRRALSFPLYRSWALTEKCRSDVAALLGRGKRTVLRCLLELKDILDHHEVYYIYSKIWIDDFCLWIQAYASDDTLKTLAQAVGSLTMKKSMLGWNLEELEALTREGGERESDSDDESEDEVERMLPAPL